MDQHVALFAAIARTLGDSSDLEFTTDEVPAARAYSHALDAALDAHRREAVGVRVL